MAHYSYFILTNSNDSLIKKFRVVMPSYKRILEKSQSINKTIDGALDISQGAIYERHEYGIRVRESESEEGYGDIEDLETFYKYNNPNGTPSDMMTLTDHFGVNHNAYFIGDYQNSLLGVMIEGGEAWSIVNAQFIFSGEPLESS